MYLVINKWVTAVKVSNFSGHYLCNHSTLDIGVLGYIGTVWPKEQPPGVRSFPPGTPCIYNDVIITPKPPLPPMENNTVMCKYISHCMQNSWVGAISLYTPDVNCEPKSLFSPQKTNTIFNQYIRYYAHQMEPSVCNQVTDSSQDSVTFENPWYRLDSPAIKPPCGQDFIYLSRPALGPTHPPVPWVLGLLPGSKVVGEWHWPPTTI